MVKSYLDPYILIWDFIKDSIQDYISYKKAQITLWEYRKKVISCTSCGIANKQELEALVIVFDHEEIQKNKREMRFRVINSKKTA
jgi:hypothetical protein